ncbi:MAG TPA: MgtC/SapB family protein [Bacteroidales bacterium]|nr:MgtC/SapB family protein [Bacteroidales bacterium]
MIDFCLRLLAGLVAGLVIGMEREWQNKPAGVRTNTLVATGSALFVLLAIRLTENYSNISDISRIIGQVVTGIGFLGAGIIFKEGTDIHGLTTAATVWCSAAVGCFAGAGFFAETLIGVAAIICVNLALIPVDRWLSKRNKDMSEKK